MSFLMLGFGFGSLGAFFAGMLAEGIGAPWSVGSLAILLIHHIRLGCTERCH